MVTGITERNQMKTELVNLGYSMKYIDDWQPKTTLYRHKAAYNDAGTATDAVGTSVPNVPGNPDYVLRKAKIGLFPWAPSESCECRWCVVGRAEAAEEKKVVAAVDSPVIGEAVSCGDCAFVAKASTKTGALAKLRAHSKIH